MSAIRTVPPAIGERLLRVAAHLPPMVKGNTLERICAALSREHLLNDRLVVTNLGLASAVRCSLPMHKSNYAFGRPQNHVMERATFGLAMVLAEDCLHFVDVGAHEGIYTFGASAALGGEIGLHWFEPDRILSRRLSLNLARNGIAARGNAVAVAGDTGRTTFFRNLTDDSSGSVTSDFAGRHLVEAEAVETIRLDDYFSRNRITRALVKIDVEGAGSLVWSGLQRSSVDVAYLIMEMLGPEIKAELPRKIMDHTGWHGYYIRDFDLVESKNGEFEYHQPFWNWLFCGLAPAALAKRLSSTQFCVISAPSEPA